MTRLNDYFRQKDKLSDLNHYTTRGACLTEFNTYEADEFEKIADSNANALREHAQRITSAIQNLSQFDSDFKARTRVRFDSQKVMIQRVNRMINNLKDSLLQLKFDPGHVPSFRDYTDLVTSKIQLSDNCHTEFEEIVDDIEAWKKYKDDFFSGHC